MESIEKDSRLYIVEKEGIDINAQFYRGNVLGISEYTINPSNDIQLKHVIEYLKDGNPVAFYANSYSLEEVKKLNKIFKDIRGYKILLLDKEFTKEEKFSEFDITIYIEQENIVGEYSFAERIANTLFSILRERCEVGMHVYDYDSVMDKNIFEAYFIEGDENIENKLNDFIDKNASDVKTILLSFEGNLEKLDIMKIGELLENVQNTISEETDVHFVVIDCKKKYEYEIIAFVDKN